MCTAIVLEVPAEAVDEDNGSLGGSRRSSESLPCEAMEAVTPSFIPKYLT